MSFPFAPVVLPNKTTPAVAVAVAAALRTEQRLVRAQRFAWIDATGARGGHPAGDQADGDHGAGHGEQREGIARRDAEEQTLNAPRQRE